MSKKSKIVDLVMGEDGTYSEKGTGPSTRKKSSHIGGKKIAEAFKSKKDTEPPNVDEFFSGVDSGLNFVENVNRRLNRFMGLRD